MLHLSAECRNYGFSHIPEPFQGTKVRSLLKECWGQGANTFHQPSLQTLPLTRACEIKALAGSSHPTLPDTVWTPQRHLGVDKAIKNGKKTNKNIPHGAAWRREGFQGHCHLVPAKLEVPTQVRAQADRCHRNQPVLRHASLPQAQLAARATTFCWESPVHLNPHIHRQDKDNDILSPVAKSLWMIVVQVHLVQESSCWCQEIHPKMALRKRTGWRADTQMYF